MQTARLLDPDTLTHSASSRWGRAPVRKCNTPQPRYSAADAHVVIASPHGTALVATVSDYFDDPAAMAQTIADALNAH